MEPKTLTRIPCITYAVKSSPDEKDSTGAQIRHIVAHVERGYDGFKPGERFWYRPPKSFHEENQSGYTGNRGEHLEDAITAAKQAVAEYGYAELWVAITSRFGRGSGRLGEARSYMALWAELQAEGIQLRSVDDDQFATMPALVGIASEQNFKYSADLSANVKRRKAEMLEKGQRLGGPVCDGYLRNVERDERDRVVKVTYAIDPEREPALRRLFALALAGHGAPMIAQTLNREGFRTKGEKGRSGWTRRRVQDTLKNPWYAGYVAQRGEMVGPGRYEPYPEHKIVEGNHPTYLTREEWRKIQAGFAQRDRSASGRARAAAENGGRPTVRYALSRIAKCGHCGAGMFCVTSPYKRKDGSQRREYVCANVRDQTGLCDAPRVDAEAADAALIPHLKGFCVDFEAWAESVGSAKHADLNALEAQADTVRERLVRLRRAETPAHDQYIAALSEGDERTAKAALKAYGQVTADAEQAEAALQELEAAVEAARAEADTDTMFDLWASLSEALRGRLDAAATMAAVNAELRAVLEAVEVQTLDNGAHRLLAIFRHKGSHEPITDYDGNPTGEWDFMPDTAEFLTPPLSPVETATAAPSDTRRNTHEPWHWGLTHNARSRLRWPGSPAQGDGRQTTLPSFVPAAHRTALTAAAQRWNVSSALLAAQIHVESGFNPFAISPAGARGIAQFMPGTARAYGLRNPHDPRAAIDAQAHLMRDLLRRFGSVALALAAYNAGPSRVAACGCIPPIPETRGYVARILGLLGGAGEGTGGGTGLAVRLVR